MAASQHWNFRLRSIPLDYETRNEVCSLIQKTLGLEPSASPTVYSLAHCPVDPNSKIATVSFPSLPESLADRSRDEWVFSLSEDNNIDFDRSLVFDTHFAGFTPFHRSSDEDCYIDVIAVCGLGGHALGSFKEKNGRFVWIRDGLPSDIPNARIFTYGYNTQLAESRSFQNLTDLGRALQVDLEGIRDPDQSRSILFIGHSLGGLVIKETVRMLKEQPLEPNSALLQAILGFAFFGVPHRGLAVECLVPLVRNYPNRALLESLNKNSSLLERLQVEFDKISQERSFFIVSFYETERSPTAVWVNGKWEMSGPDEVLVEVFSATCGCRQQHPINRNHSDMVKYSGGHDQLYRRVIVALRPVIRNTQGRPSIGVTGGRPEASVQISGDDQECLRSLSFMEQEHRYSEISYTDSTCEWLLDYSQYQSWMNKSRGLFWIKGCPGTGKSVLMKFAFDMMSRRKTGELAVSFFIHGRGVPLQRTTLGMLRALLNSLLISFPSYLTDLTKRFQDQQQRYGSYEQKNGWRWNEKELEKFLFRLLTEGTKDQPVVIFVDALDECGEEHAKRLLGSFKRLMEIAEREGSLVKICFSSRHFPILGHEMMSRVYVEERNYKDIRLVIESRLRELKPDGRRHQIENEILLKAHGGFQWAILITNMILDEDAIATRTEDLLRMISSIPPDLDELYNVLLNGATQDKHKEMAKLFQWVLFAERPLSAQELREALSTDKDMACTTVSQLRSHENWSDSISQFETRVRHISRGLVEFQDRDVYEQYEHGGEEWNREAQFIHQSAADFVAKKFFTLADGESMTGSSAGSGHYEISRSFLKYLALQEILHRGDLSREKLSATFPLMPYGVSFVLHHVRAVEAEHIPQNDLIELIQWDQPERLKMLAAIWRIMDPESIRAPRGWPFVGATDLHIAVAFGSAGLLDTLLQKDTSDLSLQDSEGNTPLHLALRENNEDLALIILHRSKTWQTEQYEYLSTDLENGSINRTDYLAHFHATNHEHETPLAFPVSVRASRAIQSLVDAGVEVRREKSLLFYAVSTEDKALLSKLIEVGADLAGAVYFTIQCLDRADHCNDVLDGILRDLLQAGADTKRFVGSEIDEADEADESDDEDFDFDEEAIFLASRYGRKDAIRVLLSHGISTMVRNNMGNTPLITAIDNLQIEAAKVLLQASPQTVLWGNDSGITVLEVLLASQESDDVVYEGIQVMVDGSDGHLTSQRVFNQLVGYRYQYLAIDFWEANRTSIRLTEPTEYGTAPLFEAVLLGYQHLVSHLIRRSNIDMSVRDENGNTMLHIAVADRNRNMAHRLLLLDIDKVLVSREDEEGYTPLWRAIMLHDKAMVELLLDPRYGLTISQEDDNGQMPLWWAIEASDEETVQMLFSSTNMDIHARNIRDQTALRWAMERKKDAVIDQVLGASRFDIDMEDIETIHKVAFWAMEHEKEHTVRLLLRSICFSTHEEIEQAAQILASWVINNKKVDMFELLFKDKRFNLRTEDETVMRGLFWLAVGKGNVRFVHFIHNSGKFDVNTKDRLGKTPLMHATESCSEETLRLLLKTGKANVQATDNEGNTALSIALRKGYRTIADLLSAHIRTTEMVIQPAKGYVTGT